MPELPEVEVVRRNLVGWAQGRIVTNIASSGRHRGVADDSLRAVIARDDTYLGEALAQSGYDWPDSRTIKLIRHFIVSDRPGDALAELAEASTRRLDASLKQLSTTIAYAVQIAVFAVIFWFLQATNQMSDLVQSTTT